MKELVNKIILLDFISKPLEKILILKINRKGIFSQLIVSLMKLIFIFISYILLVYFYIHNGVNFCFCSVKIKTATHPVPSICCKDPIDDWFNSLAECLHWNVRKLQGGPSSTTSMASLNSDEIDFNHSS